MTKPGKVCATCGTKYAADFSGELCTICKDDRQYIPHTGQKWTTSDGMLENHSVKIRRLKENLYEFVINPKFGIGQRALLVISDGGNVLWDCIPLLDEAAKSFIEQLGGLKAIAISHPHYYSNMTEWAERFDCAIYLHELDRKWVMKSSARIQYWQGGRKPLWDGMAIVKIGGHFPASSVLWAPQISQSAALLGGDTFSLSPSLDHISVMYSYPNKIPVSLAEIARIKALVKSLEFDEFYGHFSNLNLAGHAKTIFLKSLERYR